MLRPDSSGRLVKPEENRILGEMSSLPSSQKLLSLGVQATLILASNTAWDTCPFSLMADRIQEGAPQITGNVAVRRAFLPPDNGEFAEELLQWFSSQVAECEIHIRDRCSVTLEASLSKDRRKMWHRIAQRNQLESVSQGAGSERYLTISLPRFGLSPTKVGREAKQLWQLAQDAGGKFWELSQNELQQHVAQNDVPQELLELAQLRAHAAKTQAYISQGNQSAVMEILSDYPGIIWTRPPDGEYPLPNSCCKGLVEVVKKVIQLQPSALQQRSRQHGSLDDCIDHNRNHSLRDRLRAALHS